MRNHLLNLLSRRTNFRLATLFTIFLFASGADIGWNYGCSSQSDDAQEADTTSAPSSVPSEIPDDSEKETTTVWDPAEPKEPDTEAPPTPGPGLCGDGVVDKGEECDDGGTVAGDGCDNYCQKEVPGTTPPGTDKTPPTVKRSAPEMSDTLVMTRQAIAIEFSEKMDPATINTNSIIVKDATQSRSGQIFVRSYLPANTYLFAPDRHFDYGTTYFVTVTTDVTDAAGNPMANDYEIEYTTGQLDLSSGGLHTLLLRDDGKIYSWGGNTHGQVGFDDPVDASMTLVPSEIPDIPKMKAVSAGESHSLSIDIDGQVWAWGLNDHGQLGDGTKDPRRAPVLVVDTAGDPFGDVNAIAAGYAHSLALKNDGSIWAWGSDSKGQLCNGTSEIGDRTTPSQILPSHGVHIAAGNEHSLLIFTQAISGYDVLNICGSDSHGQAGLERKILSSAAYEPYARQVKGQSAANEVISAVGGAYHSLALHKDKTMRSFGSDQLGQLGLLGAGSRTKPEPVQNESIAPGALLENVNWIEAGGTHSLARQGSLLFGWGDNAYGQVGNATDPNTTPLVEFPVFITDFVMNFSAGRDFSVLIKEDGAVYTWGRNNAGQLGKGSAPAGSYVNQPTELTFQLYQ